MFTGSDQVWLSQGWVDRFALPLEPRDHGYGHSSEQVAGVDVGADLLLGYHDAALVTFSPVAPPPGGSS